MFKIVEDPEFTHEVEIAVPVDGGTERQTMSVTYQVLPVADVDEVDLRSVAATTELLERLVLRVGGLVDAGGASLEWNNRVRDRLFGLPYVRLPLIRAYFDGVSGARLKN